MTTRLRRRVSLPLLALFWAVPGQADIILQPQDPGGPTEFATVNGTIGVAGFTASSGTAWLNMTNYSTSASIATDGQFTLTAGAGQSYNVGASVYISSHNTSFAAYQYNLPALAAGTSHTVDFTSSAGLIHGDVTVTGGQASNFSLYSSVTDTARNINFNASAWTSLSQPASTISHTLLSPVGTNVSASGSITAINNNGCTVSKSLPAQQVAVATGGTTNVSWTIDVSGVTCDRGNLEGMATLSGLPAGTVTGGYVYAYGPEYRYQNLAADGTYSFLDLKAGNYTLGAANYLAAPYWFYSHPSSTVAVLGNQTTVNNVMTAVAPAHGNVQLVGPWGITHVNSAYAYAYGANTATAGAASQDQLTLPSGDYDLVMASGDWRINQYNFSFYGPSPTPGRNDSGNASISLYNAPLVSSDGASPISLPAKSFETSETLVIFHVGADANGVQQPVSQLQVNGNSTLKDPITQASTAYANISLYGYGTAATTLTSKLRGFPGTYAMNAVGIAQDGRRYVASFALELGAPVNTPVGTNVTQTSGSVGLVFDNITSAGTTTVSELTLGPPSPEGFVIYPSTQNNNTLPPQYFDITTTATFTGAVQVCINYDDTGMLQADEIKLELGHYICDASNNCSWTLITDPGYPDTTNNVLCGTTTSFSYFAILQALVTVTDMDGDGLEDNADNCPGSANADQADFDGDGIGNVCDSDSDGDGITDDIDLCQGLNHSVNTDLDGDGIGDPCDTDKDNDGVTNGYDNCPTVANASQLDFDRDTYGAACDTDDDNDRVEDIIDACLQTTASAKVDTEGCSSHQRFARACPVAADYRNHGQYVSCIANEVGAQRLIGLITEQEAGAIVSHAAHSDIGKKTHMPAPVKKKEIVLKKQQVKSAETQIIGK